MSNTNFLWEALLSQLKKELSPEILETWFLNSTIEDVNFAKSSLTIISNNSLISDYLRSVYHTKIQSILKTITQLDFTISYNYMDANNSIVSNTSIKPATKEEDIFKNNFYSKDKPSGAQNFFKKQSFQFDDTANKKTINIANNKSKNTGLNKNFQFDNFVKGEGNIYAFSIAKSVADYPGEHSPFFIYGGVGLGKTHLLHAIGNELEENNPGYKIACVSSEQFLNDFVYSIQKGNKNLDEEFRNKYRNVDALLIDDIQFLTGKTETQNAFFHTFNELQSNQKQIVLVSDRSPDQLDGLDDRLVSRFSAGVFADITPPDYETIAAIIKFKCDQYEITLEDNIISHIAGNINSNGNSNIRELEGILKEIKLSSQTTPINLTMVDAILKRRFVSKKQKALTYNDITNIVADFYNVSLQDIMSAKRNKEIAHARMVAIYLLRELTDLSLPTIGKLFNKDHSSIFYANSKIASLVAENNPIIDEIEKIKEKLKKI